MQNGRKGKREYPLRNEEEEEDGLLFWAVKWKCCNEKPSSSLGLGLQRRKKREIQVKEKALQERDSREKGEREYSTVCQAREVLRWGAWWRLLKKNGSNSCSSAISPRENWRGDSDESKGTFTLHWSLHCLQDEATIIRPPHHHTLHYTTLNFSSPLNFHYLILIQFNYTLSLALNNAQFLTFIGKKGHPSFMSRLKRAAKWLS